MHSVHQAKSTDIQHKCSFDNEYNPSKNGQYVVQIATIFVNMTFLHLNMIFGHAATIDNNSATFSNRGDILKF